MTVLVEDWRLLAACREEDPRLFFPKPAPPGRRNQDVRPDLYGPARRVCRGCTVRKDCFDSVINLPQTSDEAGMFAGLTPVERKQIRRCRTGQCEHEGHKR